MGVDACISFEAVGDLSGLAEHLPDGCSIFVRQVATYMADSYREAGSTHEVYTPWRLWSPDYPRGPWIDIAQVLGLLWRHPGVGRIWYDGDCDDVVREMTLDRFMAYNAVWAEMQKP